MIQEQLTGLLMPLLNDRFYPVRRKEKTADGTSPRLAYATYIRFGGRPENTLADGVIARNPLIQIDVYAETYTEADAISRSIILAIEGEAAADRMKAILLEEPKDLFDEKANLNRIMLQYSFWQ